MNRKLIYPLFVFLLFSWSPTYAVRFDFIAENQENKARGYFQWNESDSIFADIRDDQGNGKTLWNIQGGIVLDSSGSSVLPMVDVILEVMDNWFIDAPIPNSIIGDQITLFGTASLGSGLFSVQNFYFKDETGLLLESIKKPSSQEIFDQFIDVKVDLIPFGKFAVESYTLTEWQLVRPVPLYSAAFYFLSSLLFGSLLRFKLIP